MDNIPLMPTQFSNARKTGSAKSYLCTIRWMTRLIVGLLFVLVLVPLVTHYYISGIGQDAGATDSRPSRSLNELADTDLTWRDQCAKYNDMKFRVEELRRIKASVSNELRDLERKRQRMRAEIAGYTQYIENLKRNYSRTHAEIGKLQLVVENKRLEAEEQARRNLPVLRAPFRLLPAKDRATLRPPRDRQKCRMSTCFDFSRCSVTSMFPVYFYNPDDLHLSDTDIEPFVKMSVVHALNASPHVTYDPNIACVFVVLVGETEQSRKKNVTVFEQRLKKLSHWGGDGKNHILLNVARNFATSDFLSDVDTGRAIIVQSAFTFLQFRPKYDVILPPSLGTSHGDVWDQLAAISPARRKKFLSFQGEMEDTTSKPSNQHHSMSQNFVTRKRKSPSMDDDVIQCLRGLQQDYPEQHFRFDFSCSGDKMAGEKNEFSLCGPDSHRKDLLTMSTFVLIIQPAQGSTTLTQIRLAEALRAGAVPVVLGDDVFLPFSEIIDWKKIAIILPKARATELHFILRSFADADILEYRRQGRIIAEKVFGTTKSLIESLLALLRIRLHIPPFPAQDENSPSIFNSTFQPLTEEVLEVQEGDDSLGPADPPLASISFQRNFTFTLSDVNSAVDMFHLYPFSPFAPLMPAEAKFTGSEYGFRPINNGLGGAGKEFSGVLGGNVPREQFTIVILTYEREVVLANTISRFKSLPNLHKIVVVWNSHKSPSPDLKWPEIGVKITVIKTSRNSLNNRFLPYDAIETEAILSIDDDAHLRHDEIQFGFRVWRENRQRIVGFPGRFHGYDGKSWYYNSNYSCELSMVLTGAAFYHKYYSYIYSREMPQAIRDKVDEFMNCEDLALNFLVSHITRQPPIKVTSRWTFRCVGCDKALYLEESHFQERHKCINFFKKVYGYMPLLYTQFRADSVLFKTRIPHGKQKCFKFI